MQESPTLLPCGDQALIVEFGDAIDPGINRRVHDLAHAIESAGVTGVYDLVPTYRSLLVYYNPVRTSWSELEDSLCSLLNDTGDRVVSTSRVVLLPTLYGGEYGPDLEFVAENAGMTPDEAVELHSGTDYLVYMMGFSPGFPYLGGLDERLATPRLESPRLEIPAGSVGIAESQTGVYPVASPGGWQLIGRTPLRLFDEASEQPALLRAGDYIRFVPMESEARYLEVLESVEAGEFDVQTEAAS